MYSKKIENYKKSLKLTKFQREIIVGKLLGDGHLETNNNGKTYRLKIEHSIKQKKYVEWLYGQFENWTNGGIKFWTRNSTFPNGTRNIYQKCGFTTFSHGALRFYGKQFYSQKGVKVIPNLIGKLLTSTSISIWYLDDGSYKSQKHRTFIIHSYGYTKNELKIVQKVLLKIGIKASLHKQEKEKGICWRIYILSESAEKFTELVEPIISQIPSMKYKLGNNLPKE